ncbi:MAG: hypothetical protein LBV47_00960 [Bacteroidales bacterium]|jgi:hypothetical protein|nr:hypothetical protein [Bacteroidales bacterium]
MNNGFKIFIFVTVVFVFAFSFVAESQPVEADTTGIYTFTESNTGIVDSVSKQKSARNIFARYFYRYLFSPSITYSGQDEFSLHYYRQMQGKTISKININAIDVFGPTVEDTTRKAKNWIEHAANSIHIKSNLNTIQRMLMFNAGDTINSELMYENERIIRSLPYISDVRIILEQDTVNADYVNVHIITKDRFSFGVSGNINGTSSADVELYNKNIFGVGHEISLRFVGHTNRHPYMGLETFYSINNIKGKFINISTGYMNTYLREGFSFVMNKPFITPSIKWGYGSSVIRMYRTNQIYDRDPLKTENPFSLSVLNAWAGRSFQINHNRSNSSQIVIAAAFSNRTFFQPPDMLPPGNEYFSNSTLYLAGITFTQRRYIKDQLVYSYGITEDIPKGFKNELVYGYDVNEFGNRHYFHLSFSNGNILINRDGYLYLTGGIGGYFMDNKFLQGQIQGSTNYISRQINAGRKTFRLFLKSNYLLGINRFEIENLNLSLHDEIRGFASSKAIGKQKLSVDLEYVLFLRKEKLKFNLALFTFADVGVIGSNRELIFTQDYYSGFGLGLRLHNENLVLKTFQLRLAFYPFHPDDMSFTGFMINEQLKNNFYSFEPQAPQPLIFR